MKKVLLSCFITVLMLGTVTLLRAEANFYGSARLSSWYESTDKAWNSYSPEIGINESNLELNYAMQGNSRLGAIFTSNDVSGKLELGISPSQVNLRLLYGKITKDDMSITIGQNYSGFTAYGDQVYADDLNFINYGLFYDGRLPMIKFTFKDRFNAMILTPKEVDVTNHGGLKSLIPKINLSYEYTDPKIYFSTSVGVNINKYNKNFNSDNLDDLILAYAVTLTGKYDLGMLNLLAQISYGMNAKNYGIYTITQSSIVYDAAKKTFEDTQTLGGVFIVSSKLLTTGVSYLQTSNSLWSDDDTAISAFIQRKINISKNAFLVPEIGLMDNMKDFSGVNEGKKIYGGMKIQIDM